MLWAPVGRRAAQRKLDQRLRDLRQLDILQRWAAAQRAALQRFEALPAARPAALESCVRAVITNAAFEIRDGGAENAVPGWRVRHAAVVVRGAAFTDLGRLLFQLETNQPPWRLTGIAIDAEPEEGRAAEATLQVEALERSPAASNE
jgi:hypothetical protein